MLRQDPFRVIVNTRLWPRGLASVTTSSNERSRMCDVFVLTQTRMCHERNGLNIPFLELGRITFESDGLQPRRMSSFDWTAFYATFLIVRTVPIIIIDQVFVHKKALRHLVAQHPTL